MGGIATRTLTQMTNLRHRASDMLFGGNRSTIDTIRMAPPPSPLAPVDLTDPLSIHRVTDVAARIGTCCSPPAPATPTPRRRSSP